MTSNCTGETKICTKSEDIEKSLVKLDKLTPKSARLRDEPTEGIDVASSLLADFFLRSGESMKLFLELSDCHLGQHS